MKPTQKLAVIHSLEREEENLRRSGNMIEVLKDELQRGTGAREVAVALTNLETALLWLGHAIAVARTDLPK